MGSDKQYEAVSRVQEHCQLSGHFLCVFYTHIHNPTHKVNYTLHVLHLACSLFEWFPLIRSRNCTQPVSGNKSFPFVLLSFVP